MPVRIGTRLALIAALAVAAFASAASSASAAPQVLIREVGRGATSQSDYVMLQMTADGQNNLAGNYIDFLSADGMANGEYQLPNVPNGQNQRTVLIGNTGVSGADFSDAGVANQTDGAVCLSTHGGYDGTGGFDCVAWGNFTGWTHPLRLRPCRRCSALSRPGSWPDAPADHRAGLRDGARCRRRH